MASALPLLAVAGGAALLLSGKKKKKAKSDVSRDLPRPDEGPPLEEEPLREGTGDDEEMDFGTGPGGEQYGETVASGLRSDRRGPQAWRVRYESDGYHAQLMAYVGRTSPIAEEIGITATLKAAKELIRDQLNALLLGKYPNEKPKADPIPFETTFTPLDGSPVETTYVGES